MLSNKIPNNKWARGGNQCTFQNTTKNTNKNSVKSGDKWVNAEGMRGSGKIVKDMNNQLKRSFILALLTVMFIVMLNMNTLIFQVRETINLKSKVPKIWISMGKFYYQFESMVQNWILGSYRSSRNVNVCSLLGPSLSNLSIFLNIASSLQAVSQH